MVIPTTQAIRVLILAFATLVMVAGRLPAQTPAQRAVIEAFRDSLEQTGDSAGLRRLEARLVGETRRSRADPFGHLRLAFVALRMGDLGDLARYEDAASEFQAVTRLAAAWPFGWYGLGLAELSIGRVAPVRPAAGEAPVPEVSFRRAASALSRATLLDPGFVAVLVEEAYIGRRRRMAARSAVMLEALRLTVRSPNRAPAALHGLGRLEREFGDPAAALQAFDGYLRLSGGGRNRGLALLEVARTRFLLGRLDGSAPYYEGAGFDDSPTVTAYRGDLATISTETDLVRFDRVRGPGRAAFLRRFWGSRDAMEFRPEGERLREHYRRMFHVRRTFPLFAPRPPEDRLLRIAGAPDQSVDDRGVIYLRHGPPDQQVELATLGVEPNESWQYARAEGDLVLHFAARQDPDEYRLVESLFDLAGVRGSGPAEPIDRGRARAGDEMLLRSREPLSSFYRQARPAEGDRDREFRVAERAMSRTGMTTALATDSHRRLFPHALGAAADLVLLGEPDETPAARIAVAVPFDALGVSWLRSGITYPLRLRMVVVDTSGVTVLAVDSTISSTAVEWEGQRWLAGVTTWRVSPGRSRVRLAVEDGDSAGTLLSVRSLDFPLVGNLGLQMSDLALGIATGPWLVPVMDNMVALSPSGRLPRAEAQVAYAVTTRSGETLRSQLTLMRTDDQAAVVMSRSFTEPAADRHQLIRHPLDLRRLKPGRYRLEVTVTDGAGAPTRRWREFTVDPGPGGRN